MARTKRHRPNSKRPKAGPAKKRAPNLLTVLPRQGFLWHSRHGTRFVSNVLSRKIVWGARRYINLADPIQVVAQLARMFEAACAMLEQLGTGGGGGSGGGGVLSDPVAFWNAVAAGVPWMSILPGNVLRLFAFKVLSARAAAKSAVRYYAAIEDTATVGTLQAETRFTQAVDKYTGLISLGHTIYAPEEGHGGEGGGEGAVAATGRKRTLIADLYMPWWVHDPDNQGDEASTIAYRKLLSQLDGMGLEERAKVEGTYQPRADAYRNLVSEAQDGDAEGQDGNNGDEEKEDDEDEKGDDAEGEEAGGEDYDEMDLDA